MAKRKQQYDEVDDAPLLESKADELARHNLSGDRHIAQAVKELRDRAAALRAISQPSNG